MMRNYPDPPPVFVSNPPPLEVLCSADGKPRAQCCTECGWVIEGAVNALDMTHCRTCYSTCHVCSKVFRRPPHSYPHCCSAACDKQWCARARAAAFAEGTKTPAASYDGPVYDADHDRFHADMQTFMDWWEDEHGDETPVAAWVYACMVRPLRVTQDDVVEMLQSIQEDHHENAAWDDDLWPLIKDGVEAFNARQFAASWDVDFKHAVVIDPARCPEVTRA